MPNKTPLTANDPIKLEMLNSFVQESQIEHQNEGEIWLLSKEKIQNFLTTKADKSNFTKFIFNDERVTTLKDGYTYYGSTIDNATVSSGTYYFYNCTGALTVSGKNATVYATNCPRLTINGKVENNWQNIWVDGVASYDNIIANSLGSRILRFLDGTQIISGFGLAYAEDAPTVVKMYFPVSFDDNCYTVTGNMRTGTTDYKVILGFEAVDSSSCSVSFTLSNPNVGPFRTIIQYTAIGRKKQ